MNSESPATINGFADGARVYHRRWALRGTVRHLSLTEEERATGEYAEAEVCFDSSFGAVELAVVADELEARG